MICRFCSARIPDESLFCLACGERVARKKRGSSSPPKRYPKPRKLSDGSLLGQLMIDGRRETVKAATEAEYRARIDALRTGVLERKAHPDRRTLREIVRAYIDKNDRVLSPATIRGYEIIHDNRFPAWIDKPVCSIDFQRMVNDEAALVSPKTLKNAWGLVRTAMSAAGLPVPDVNLPQVPEPDGDFLDFEQIQIFLREIRGDAAECAALLMLHSLRTSELLALDAEDISGGIIHVSGAVVQDKDNKLVAKATNKNRTSARDVPVMIPRLLEILPPSGKAVTVSRATFRRHILDACTRAGLPPCSPHDLRRSFASLAKHLHWDPVTLMRVGGWSDMNTVNRIYAKLAERDRTCDIERMQDYYQITTAAVNPSDISWYTPLK